MELSDCLTLDASGLAFTRDGFLTGNAKVSRAGNVQHYHGSELGLTGDDRKKVFGVYRDPDVVFDKESMRSLIGRPVTRGHPPAGVNAANWKDLTVGQVGAHIARDGEHVTASMAIMDATAANEVFNGARSLSAGYTVEIIRDEGVSPDGEPFQFRQSGALRFNHVAYLPDNNPRAGNTRMGDNHWGAPLVQNELARVAREQVSQQSIGDGSNPTRIQTMSDNNPTRTVMVDGLSVVTTDAGAVAIDKLKGQVQDGATALSDANTAHATAIAAKDADIAKRDAEITDLKAKVLDAAAVDALVASRSALIESAKTVNDADYAGKTDMEIVRAAVAAKFGDAALLDSAGKPQSDAYIRARFDIAVADAKADPVRAALKDGVTAPNAGKSADDARAKMIADAQSAHRPTVN